MKYCGKYCNIIKISRHPQKPLNFCTKEKGTHQNGIICTMCFIKNAIVLNVISKFYHMKPKWWTTNAHVANVQDLYQTIRNSNKGTCWDGIWHSPNLWVPLGREGDAPSPAGPAECEPAHCCTLSTPRQGTAFGSNEQPWPSPSILTFSPRAPPFPIPSSLRSADSKQPSPPPTQS